MRKPQPAQEAETAAVVVEIVRTFEVHEPYADGTERSHRKTFAAGDKHVVDKATAQLWKEQGHAREVDADTPTHETRNQ